MLHKPNTPPPAHMRATEHPGRFSVLCRDRSCKNKLHLIAGVWSPVYETGLYLDPPKDALGRFQDRFKTWRRRKAGLRT